MTNVDRNIGKCKICGTEFARKRISKTTCSDRCRKALNRKKQADSAIIATQVVYALQSISIIRKMLEEADYSYDAALSIKYIINEAIGAMPAPDSMWHCRSCGKIVRYQLPTQRDKFCNCEKPQWVLEKKML